MQKRVIELFRLLKEGVCFRRLSDPLHMGRSTVQECRLIKKYSVHPDGQEEGPKWPVTDVLYTWLRPLNIRRLEIQQQRQWGILLSPSYSLYRVRRFDHKRRIVEIERVWGSRIYIDSLDYLPYSCYPDSSFSYGEKSNIRQACIPEFVTYITFSLLPEADKPLLYICGRKRDHVLEALNLVYISRPMEELDSIPVVYSYDCSFVWIGVTLEDLRRMGFRIPPVNYKIEEITRKVSKTISFNRKYAYDDLLESQSVNRAIRSHAVVKVYIDALDVKYSSWRPILDIEDHGFYVGIVPKICFKKVLLGSRLRTTTTMASSTPIYINMGTYQRGHGGGIGVRIVNSEGLAILFEKDKFRKLIEGIILSNIKLLKTLLLKYLILRHCYVKYVDYYDFNAIIDFILALIFNEDVELIKKYYDIFHAGHTDEIIFNFKKIRLDYNDFIKYATKVALYSLAQVLAKVIISHVLHTRLDNFTLYVSEEYKVKKENREIQCSTIMILENSHEGLGFIEQLYKMVRTSPERNLLSLIIDPALQMLVDSKSGKDLCLLYHESIKQRDRNLVASLCRSSQELDQIRRHLQYLVHEWNKNVNTYFPSDFMRLLLYRYLGRVDQDLRRKLNMDAFLRSAIPQIYNVEAPFCWDSCQRCVRLKKAYLLSPIDQIFYTSKSLTIGLLKALSDILKPGKNSSIRTGCGLGHSVLNLMKHANSEIRIMSPWISPDIVRQLINLALEKGLKIRIITHPPKRGEPKPHIQAIQILKKASKRLDKIKVKYDEKVHAKVIIIDDKLLITGSMNLTKRGTEINIESITVCRNKAEIYTTIADYEKLWINSLSE